MISCLNLKLIQIGWKAFPPPPPYFLPFGEILSLCHVTSRKFAKPYLMHHKTSHLGPGRTPPPPPPTSRQTEKNSETGSIHFMQFPATLVNWQKIPPPPNPLMAKQGKILRLDPSISCHFQQLWFTWQKSSPTPSSQTGKNSETRSIHFIQFRATLVQLAEKPPPLFCLFVRDLARIAHVEYPWSPYYKSTLRFLLSEFCLQVPNFVNFSKYSHIQKYRIQDHGAGGRPIGSLTTIHTNIPAIIVTVLTMALWSVIRILYLYACMSLTG